MEVKMIKILSALFFSIFLFGCTTDSSDPRSIKNNKYDNSAIGLTIQFPTNWQLKLDQKYGSLNIDLVALGPPISGFSPNVSNIIQNHTGSATVNWSLVLDSAKAQLQAQIPDLGSFTDTVLTLDGSTYAEMSYTTTSQGNLLKIKQDLLLNRNKEITLTYTDFASRFDQNTDFVSIQSNMTIY
jgi:hypothetical protein